MDTKELVDTGYILERLLNVWEIFNLYFQLANLEVIECTLLCGHLWTALIQFVQINIKKEK